SMMYEVPQSPPHVHVAGDGWHVPLVQWRPRPHASLAVHAAPAASGAAHTPAPLHTSPTAQSSTVLHAAPFPPRSWHTLDALQTEPSGQPTRGPGWGHGWPIPGRVTHTPPMQMPSPPAHSPPGTLHALPSGVVEAVAIEHV